MENQESDPDGNSQGLQMKFELQRSLEWISFQNLVEKQKLFQITYKSWLESGKVSRWMLKSLELIFF